MRNFVPNEHDNGVTIYPSGGLANVFSSMAAPVFSVPIFANAC